MDRFDNLFLFPADFRKTMFSGRASNIKGIVQEIKGIVIESAKEIIKGNIKENIRITSKSRLLHQR